jgi:hypothetical protein
MAQTIVLYEDSVAQKLLPNEEKNVVYHDPKIFLQLALLVKKIALPRQWLAFFAFFPGHKA